MSTLHIVFRVGEADYVLSASEVLHVESYEGATPVPGTSPWVAGLVQVRRRVVPVVDLRARFGLGKLVPTLASRVIVVQDKARSVGLAVDSSREVIHLGAEQFKQPPELLAEQANGFVKKVAQAHERLFMLLDVERVVGPEAQLGTSEGEVLHGE